MEEYENELNSTNTKRPQLRLKELYKYYQDQDTNKLLEDISPRKRKKFLEQIKRNQKVKYNNMKSRYNEQSYNEYETDSLRKNKSCPKLINNNSNDSNNSQFNNYNYYLNNKTDFSNQYTPQNIYSNPSIYKNNSDYYGDDNIFTRIVPNFENSKSFEDKENNSAMNYLNNSFYNNNTCDINHKKVPKNPDFIYHKSKTPNKTCIYHKKKKKNYYNYNYEDIANNSYMNNSYYENKLNDNESIYSKRSDDSARIIELLKKGKKFELNKDKKNDYIDLLTISEIKNMEKQRKLKNLQNQKNSKINYSAIQNPLSSQRNTNISNESYESSETFNNNNNTTYPNRNNNFLAKKNNNKNKNGEQANKDAQHNKRNYNKSYDCITFKKKIGILNNKKKKKKSKRNKTSDIIHEKGTPIKKENERGGIVVFYPNKLKSNNHNRNIKTKKLKEKNNIPVPHDEKNDYYTETKTITESTVIIQKWWKKVNYKFIKKIIIIQKIYREYLNRKQSQNLNQNNKIYKKKKLKNIYISKDYYQLPNNEIILIQNKFRDYLQNKNNSKYKLNQYINYIPKDICQITKIRLNPSINKESLKQPKNAKNNNITIRKIKNNLATIQSNMNKKHGYTGSKLFQSDINKILLSSTEIRYETNNYTYLKKSHFRKRSNSSEDEDNDDETNKRPFTCEIMRKIKFTPDKRHLTPDNNRNRNNIKINPNLKIIKLDDTQYLYGKKKQNKKKNKNKLKESPSLKNNTNSPISYKENNSINDLDKNNSNNNTQLNDKISPNNNENNNNYIKQSNKESPKVIDNNENNYKISYTYYKKNSNNSINSNKDKENKENKENKEKNDKKIYNNIKTYKIVDNNKDNKNDKTNDEDKINGKKNKIYNNVGYYESKNNNKKKKNYNNNIKKMIIIMIIMKIITILKMIIINCILLKIPVIIIIIKINIII